MFVNYKSGDWVLYKGNFACVHTTHHKRPNRVLVEWIEEYPEAKWIQRDWVHNSSLTPLDPAVSSLLSSIYQAV